MSGVLEGVVTYFFELSKLSVNPVSEFAVGQEAVYIAYEFICCGVPEVRILADQLGYDIRYIDGDGGIDIFRGLDTDC